MDIRNPIKKFVLGTFPDWLLQPAKKIHYAKLLSSISECEDPDIKIIGKLINPGDYVVDIGANYGFYTKFLSELVRPDGRVYSIEPIPLSFEILCSNVRKLGLQNVELINCAVSDFNGTVTMQVPLDESGVENFYQASVVLDDIRNDLRTFKIESRTIDSLFTGLQENLSFIKCDVEGHELNCIKGALGVIHRSKPAWCIEITGDPDDSLSSGHESFRLLTVNGYEPYWADGEDLKQRQSGDKSVNYFFLTHKHLNT
jgi:FkbM family methyltransferase